MTTESDARHWDDVYDRVGADRVSWYQTGAAVSLEFIAAAGSVRSVVDIGGGASILVDELLDSGVEDVTVLDLSARALDVARQRIGSRGDAVRWVNQDVRSWRPPRRFDVWHDRAVFHFLTEPADRDAYRSVLREALEPRSSRACERSRSGAWSTGRRAARRSRSPGCCWELRAEPVAIRRPGRRCGSGCGWPAGAAGA